MVKDALAHAFNTAPILPMDKNDAYFWRNRERAVEEERQRRKKRNTT